VAKINNNAPQLNDISKDKVRLCDANARAACSFCAPMACPTLTSEPTLFRREIDVDIHVRIPTEPTAAIASLPILPTQAMSVRLYAICMNEVAIMGIAKVNNCFRIGP